MTDLEAAFEHIANRGRERDPEAVVDAALQTRRPRSRRVPAVMMSVAAALLVVVAATAVYVRSRVDDINRVDVSSALSETSAVGAPTTMLVVGVDRPHHGAAERGRADAIVLARFDPTAHTMAFLSVPRDLRVAIPGTGREDRLGVAYAAGPERLVEAVAAVTGIRPQHYVEVDFAGFARLVDAAGGVKLHFPAPSRDRLSGLDVDAGCQTLDGETALAFVRARHFETRGPDGRYSTDPTGDLGRMQRQAHLINVVLADFPSRFADDLAGLNRVADALTDAVTLDSQLSVGRLVQYAREIVRHPPARSFLSLPATPVRVDDAVFLQVDQSLLPGVVAAFAAAPADGRTDGPSC